MKYKKEKYTIIEIENEEYELEQVTKIVNYQLAKVILKYLEKLDA